MILGNIQDSKVHEACIWGPPGADRTLLPGIIWRELEIKSSHFYVLSNLVRQLVNLTQAKKLHRVLWLIKLDLSHRNRF